MFQAALSTDQTQTTTTTTHTHTHKPRAPASSRVQRPGRLLSAPRSFGIAQRAEVRDPAVPARRAPLADVARRHLHAAVVAVRERPAQRRHQRVQHRANLRAEHWLQRLLAVQTTPCDDRQPARWLPGRTRHVRVGGAPAPTRPSPFISLGRRGGTPPRPRTRCPRPEVPSRPPACSLPRWAPRCHRVPRGTCRLPLIT